MELIIGIPKFIMWFTLITFGVFGWIPTYESIKRGSILDAILQAFFAIVADMFMICIYVKKSSKIKNKDIIFAKLLITIGVFMGVGGNIIFLIGKFAGEIVNSFNFIAITAFATAIGAYGVKEMNEIKEKNKTIEQLQMERNLNEHKSVVDNHQNALEMLEAKKRKLEKEQELLKESDKLNQERIKRRNEEKERMKKME